ncbi:MAG: biosynthetic peptidoglycan transglycosylase [Bacteroidota bacterium]
MKIPAFFKSKLLKRILVILVLLFLLLLVVFLLARNSILHSALEKKINAFNDKYPAKLIIIESHFSGITGIELNGIYIIPDNKDTLIQLENIYTGLKFFPMLFGKISISNLEVNNCSVHIVSKDSTDNFSFLLKKKNTVSEKHETGYATAVDKLSDAVFSRMPDDVLLKNINIYASVDSSEISAFIETIKIEDHHFLCPVKMTEGKTTSLWNIKGTINKNERTAGVTVYPEKVSDYVPFVKNMFGLTMKFDSLLLGLENNSYKGDIYQLNGYVSIYGLRVNHKKISTTDVTMQKALFECNFNIGKDFIELDSTSSLVYNTLVLNPYFLFQSGGSKKYTLKIHDEFDAQDFFGSLPVGLFTNFENIQTSGRLLFSLDFFVDMKQTDSLEFTAGLTGKDFKVVKYGETDFSKIAGPFTYTAYEDGFAAASFLVGPDNPNFTPIEDISLPLKEAVIIAENGGTYYQTGFDINSLRLAIIQDIKEKKFIRGGSTIEMQLVKNVFLTKSKTIARKAEELLIVWLIQSGNLCSHNRMFEVYLNIAEWGPGVYGINQAAKFYFNKTPSLLTVPESIFLASILPRPKWYKYSFDKAGNLDPEMNGAYFNSIATLLVERGTISPADTFNLMQKVQLRAESKILMMKDTSYFDNNEIRRQDEEFLKKDQKNVQKNDQKNNNQNLNRSNNQNDNRRKDPRKK